jgi:hypothetical protein
LIRLTWAGTEMPYSTKQLSAICVAGAFVLTAFAMSARDTVAQEFEQTTVFKASQILPPTLLSGPNHKVKEVIVNDGYINRYTIESKYGSFDGVTSAKLRKRIREINALAVMEKVRGTKVFRESVVEAGGDVLHGVKMLVTSPIDTTKGAVSGVGKTFGRIGEHLFGSERSNAEDPRWKSLIGFSKTKRICLGGIFRWPDGRGLDDRSSWRRRNRHECHRRLAFDE